jgi:hypothetical protein
MVYQDRVYLIDREAETAWDMNNTPIGTTDLPSSTNPLMIADGDMVPWRLRLSIDNTGANGEVNSGSLKLRIDEKGTFIRTGPKLMSEEAKEKYLIEAYIIQKDENGSDVESKRFRFQLGSPNLDTSKELGQILTISLQEIQYRLRETVSSRNLRFVTPYQALNARIIDFNSHQAGSGYLISVGLNNLPDVENLQQNYIPQGAKRMDALIDDIFNGLEEPQALGGLFKDFYYDFEPTASTKIINIKADEIGREDTGIILDPLSVRAIDSEQEQSVFTDFVRYKNHVIMRGSPNSGSLPLEHSIYSSKWVHSKFRNVWKVTNEAEARDGTIYNYLKGQTVRVEFNTGIPENPKIYRFFVALKNITFPPPHPTTSPTSWEEDFITIPEFSNTGQYYENDLVYFSNGPEIRFYRAKVDILAFRLNGFRRGLNDGDDPQLDSDKFLKDPDQDTSSWEDMSTAGIGRDTITAHSTSSFIGYEPYSPWTQDIFVWEKNMVGLTSGSLITNNDGTHRYVGLTPDWNMCKDVYEKQVSGDEFSNITFKWVRNIGINDVSSTPTVDELDYKEKYHNQKVIVGSSPSTEFTDDFNEQFSSGSPANRLATYSVSRQVFSVSLKKFVTSAGWIFSEEPVNNDSVFNLDDGKIYYWNGSSWVIGWEYERIETTEWGNPSAVGACSHPVKDVYKTRGFEGTPNSAVEFRYVWDTNELFPFGSGGDDNDRKERLSRLASGGAWLWFWNPFPRLGISETSHEVGDLFGSNPIDAVIPSTQFTTLNINNSDSDRFQNIRGWNNGLNSEDMGRISGISFKLKVGLFADNVDESNDLNFNYLHSPVVVREIPMIFWCVDDFQRIWYTKFKLRMNNVWDQVNIPFGDSSIMNLYTAKWQDLSIAWGIPDLFGGDAQSLEKEYTGVRFDWEFVRGWGVMLESSYSDIGYYLGGYERTKDNIEGVGSQITNLPKDAFAQALKVFENTANFIATGNVEEYLHSDVSVNRSYTTRQATIAIDDLYYTKELTVNSDDATVQDARTVVESKGNEDDYINLKILAKSKKARLSFYPQFWSFRGVGDVRMRVGQNFYITGSRIPDNPNQYFDWDSQDTYSVGEKVSFTDGYAYVCIVNTSTGESPTTSPEKWDNLNKLVCSNVKHIIDSTGYTMEVEGRRKFVVG